MCARYLSCYVLLADNIKAKITVVPVKLGTIDGSRVRAALQDLVVLTGGSPVIWTEGQTARNVTPLDFGRARRGWANFDHFGLSGGKGDPRQLRQHIFTLRGAYNNAEKAETRDQLQTRIGKLMGGTAILHINGATETERETRKTIAKRTARVLRGAVTTGVLPGGGTALLACQAALAQQEAQQSELEGKMAYRILAKAMETPIRTLMENAGEEPAQFLGQFLGQIKQQKAGMVFDLRNKQVVDAVTAGILDVAAVQKAAVERAIRSAALALTIDVLVHVKNPKRSLEP